MNLLLLFPNDFLHDNTVKLTDERRINHMINIQKVTEGMQLNAGLANGLMGKAVITKVSASEIFLTTSFDTPPPPKLDLTLHLGLPRPQMLKRTLQNISCLGIKKLVLFQSRRVEKSYWQSPLLELENIQRELVLGLEQGCDTEIPKVTFEKHFETYFEKSVAPQLEGTLAIVAHPYVKSPCPEVINKHIHLAIGPEGGFIEKEIDHLLNLGFSGVSLGPRILKVETVIPFLAGKLS